MPYLELDEFRDHLKIRSNDRDVELARHLGGTERIMRYLCGPPSVETFTEVVRVPYSGKLLLAQRPVVAVTSITPVGSTGAIGSATVVEDAVGGVVGLVSGCLSRGRYTVVYTAGHAEVEDNQVLAAQIIGQHLWRLANGGGGAPYPGQDDAVPIGMGYAVPRRALELLGIEATPAKVGGFA